MVRQVEQVQNLGLDAVLRQFKTETKQNIADRALGAPHKRFPAGLSLPSSPDKGRLFVVLSGWACEQRISADGRRQIYDFILPGDLVDCHDGEASDERTTVPITALTVLDLSQTYGAKAADLTWSSLAAVAQRAHRNRLYDHLTRLAHKSAYERVAHMLVDFYDRLSAVGMTERRRYALPLTQEVLADALGMTLVHVNRILQQLRHQGLIEFSAGFVELKRLNTLVDIADYRGCGHTDWRSDTSLMLSA